MNFNIRVNAKRTDKGRHTIPVEPLDGIKLGVWCAVSATVAFRPIIFPDKINWEIFNMQIIVPFFTFESVINERRNS
jgi:hypothetical protein